MLVRETIQALAERKIVVFSDATRPNDPERETQQEQNRDNALRKAQIQFLTSVEALQIDGEVVERGNLNPAGQQLTKLTVLFSFELNEDFWLIDEDNTPATTLMGLLEEASFLCLNKTEQLARRAQIAALAGNLVCMSTHKDRLAKKQ